MERHPVIVVFDSRSQEGQVSSSGYHVEEEGQQQQQKGFAGRAPDYARPNDAQFAQSSEILSVQKREKEKKQPLAFVNVSVPGHKDKRAESLVRSHVMRDLRRKQREVQRSHKPHPQRRPT